MNRRIGHWHGQRTPQNHACELSMQLFLHSHLSFSLSLTVFHPLSTKHKITNSLIPLSEVHPVLSRNVSYSLSQLFCGRYLDDAHQSMICATFSAFSRGVRGHAKIEKYCEASEHIAIIVYPHRRCMRLLVGGRSIAAAAAAATAVAVSSWCAASSFA